MGTEIERKFRIVGESWRPHVGDEGVPIRQFYLAVREGFSARIRLENGERATLTIKTGRGLSRGEFEYDVPVADALALEPSRLGITIEKRRYKVPLAAGELVAEIDVYDGDLAPLVIAEVELPDETFDLATPDWLGPEVTGDPLYLNAGLALSGAAPALSRDLPIGKIR